MILILIIPYGMERSTLGSDARLEGEELSIDVWKKKNENVITEEANMNTTKKTKERVLVLVVSLHSWSVKKPRWKETTTKGGNASPPPNPLFLRCRHVRLCKAGIPREGVHTYHSVAERRLWRYSKARAEDMKLMTEYITRLLSLPENKIK